MSMHMPISGILPHIVHAVRMGAIRVASVREDWRDICHRGVRASSGILILLRVLWKLWWSWVSRARPICLWRQ